jgi:hypothetical protein
MRPDEVRHAALVEVVQRSDEIPEEAEVVRRRTRVALPRVRRGGRAQEHRVSVPAAPVRVGHLVRDRVFGQGRQPTQHVLSARGGATLDGEHVGHERECVAAAQVTEVPVARSASVELDVEDLANAAGMNASSTLPGSSAPADDPGDG